MTQVIGARQRFNEFFVVILNYFSVLSLPFILWIMTMAQKFSTMQSVTDDTPVYYPAWVDDDIDGENEKGGDVGKTEGGMGYDT